MSDALAPVRQPILLPDTPRSATSVNEHWCEHPGCKNGAAAATRAENRRRCGFASSIASMWREESLARMRHELLAAG